MAPPPELIDDVTAEIFLRLPPDEPEHLFRASLVCKSWFRVLIDPDFLRRYRTFHRTPALLGYLHSRQVIGGGPDPSFYPTAGVPFTPYPYFRRALDSHHGRALLHVDNDGWYFTVWDPVTGDQQRVPDADIDWLIYSAAVFCPVSGCDHLHCQDGPFRVVFIATDDIKELVKACVYSSETGAWSTAVTLDIDCETYAQHRQNALSVRRFHYTPYVQPRRGALVGDDIYFTLRWNNAIVKYNWVKNCISMIDPPSHSAYYMALMEMGNNTLGFACIEEGWNLYLWSRKVKSEAAAEWMQCRVIELSGLIPIAIPEDEAFVVGSAEGVDVIFVTTTAGLFSFELRSARMRKVAEPNVYFSVLPYMSFYTPGTLLALAQLINFIMHFSSCVFVWFWFVNS
ncbi:hypothetical protein EJB05_14418, partial [Eragrostis curvula]